MKKCTYSALNLLFAVIAVCFLLDCTSLPKDKGDTLKPYNYNKRNIYVYAIKAIDSSGKLVYNDTLGLMCSNQLWKPDSLQKWINWLYLSKAANQLFILNPRKASNSSTGIRSTEKELFLHPPRDDQYAILETCPFPYFFFPLSVGKKWNWNLEVGAHYSNSTIQWAGNEIFHSHYEVSEITDIHTLVGKFNCFHIKAVNTSRFGVSNADFYYNYEYGLVKMQYAPLDKTILTFDFIQSFNDNSLFKKMRYNERIDFVIHNF